MMPLLLKFVNMNHQKYTKFTDLNNASGYKIFQPVLECYFKSIRR